MGSAAIEVVNEAGTRLPVQLTPDFIQRIRLIVTEPEAGYSDVADLIRAALRAEVDKAERGIYGRRRKW